MITKELEECFAAFDAAQEQIRKIVHGQIAAAARELFNKYEFLESFGWQQYTDYFNDGEECNFYARTDGEQLFVNGERVWDANWYNETTYEGYNSRSPNPNCDRFKKQAVGEISNFIEAIGTGRLKEVFGDHKEITVNKDGILVEDYSDHD